MLPNGSSSIHSLFRISPWDGAACAESGGDRSPTLTASGRYGACPVGQGADEPSPVVRDPGSSDVGAILPVLVQSVVVQNQVFLLHRNLHELCEMRSTVEARVESAQLIAFVPIAFKSLRVNIAEYGSVGPASVRGGATACGKYSYSPTLAL